MFSKIASPAFMDSLLPQSFAGADIEDRYSHKQRRRRQENDVQHHFSLTSFRPFAAAPTQSPL